MFKQTLIFSDLGLTFPFWDDYDNDYVHSVRKN